MSNVKFKIIKNTQAEAQQEAEADAAAAAAKADAQPNAEGHSSGRTGVIAGAVLVVAAVAAIALSSMVGNGAGAAIGDSKEGINASAMAQLDTNRSALEKTGMKAGTLRFRDWGVIDGDALTLNGAFVGPLRSDYLALSTGAGSMIIQAKAGSLGCVSVEVADEAGAVYQLCLKDGEPIKTFAY